jgi:metallo-beta-lactamase family protein
MKVSLYGAGLEVTGSCYKVETETAAILVDCGLFQGSKRLERENTVPKSMNVRSVNAVVLTHGHLDHCGRLPLIVKAGFQGKIYATEGTIDVAKLILTDAARVQTDDVLRENRRRAREGQPPLTPLFKQADVERVFTKLAAVEYGSTTTIDESLSFRLVEAGHILGSASVVLHVIESGGTRKEVVFSGDVGPPHVPIMRDPEEISYADAVFLEATYGDRDHRSLEETIAEFQEIMVRGVELGGKILIPTFAIGRAQQMLYHLSELFSRGKVTPIPIYLDSPMAIAATELYTRHRELMDKDAGIFLRSSITKALPELKFCISPEESKALNGVQGSCVILAGAGMCNAGRILHHLRHNLNSPQTAVVMVGYQAKGSLGRLLLEGAKSVRLFGETVPVRATVRGLGGFSAHAGQSDLLGWLEPMTKQKRPEVFLVHGEPHPMNVLAQQLRLKYEIRAHMPRIRETVVI